MCDLLVTLVVILIFNTTIINNDYHLAINMSLLPTSLSIEEDLLQTKAALQREIPTDVDEDETALVPTSQQRSLQIAKPPNYSC